MQTKNCKCQCGCNRELKNLYYTVCVFCQLGNHQLMATGKFGTVINCIDGRTQLPVLKWIKENYSLQYVDTITEPGPDKVISEKSISKIEQLKSKVFISIKAHGSRIVIIAGHHDCAVNPVSKTEHLDQIKKSIKVMKSWNLEVEIFGIWVNEEWKIERVE